jgi:glycosyltransferase involved in cell wall biosynthesis
MRILQIGHNWRVVGGSDAALLATTRLLEQAGHEVIPFCLSHPDNLPSEHAPFFPRGADTARPRLRDLPRYFWNREAAARLGRLLDAAGPVDVAHLHIYHGKHTPAILPVLRARAIPIVQTLHEYKLACPVYTMQRGGRPCTLCLDGSTLNALRHRCKEGSALKSALMLAEFHLSRLLGDVRLIERFICVSDFQRRVMERAGLPAEKLVTLHNFGLPESPEPAAGHEGYLLHFGRIERLKGLPALLDAVENTRWRLLIAGEGGWREALMRRIAGMENVEYLGFVGGDALRRLVARARAVVVPSQWPENCPMNILEAKALGRPVVAARIGGIPELVRDGIDGLLFRPGDVEDLRRALAENERLGFSQLSRQARRDWEERFSPQAHLRRLLAIYAAARAKPARAGAALRARYEPTAPRR